MPRRLPPLTSLKTFEVAGRLLSFTRAATELGVTQAAVSHQIKTLEQHLATSLFIRLPRRLELTPAGCTLLPVVSKSFDSISEVLTSLRVNPARPSLAVRLAPTFAAMWLSPRMEDFHRLHPEINLSLFHSNAAVNFEQEEIDIAVTYGIGRWPNVVADKLFTLDFFPVCCPAFLTADPALSQIQDLQHYTLLHDTNYKTWTDWLAMAGAVEVDPNRGIVIDDTNVLIQAAIDGQGVALCSSAFVDKHLGTKRLIKPFDLALQNDFAYFVVCPKEHLKRPAVIVFRDWLLSQAAISAGKLLPSSTS